MTTVTETTPDDQASPYAWLVAQAYEMRRKGGPWAAMLADRIDDLARDVAFTKARTPGDLADRIAVLEDARVERAVAAARMRDAAAEGGRGYAR